LAVAPGLDLPPGLFEKRVRREKQASALTPALSPEREREEQASALTPALSPERERGKQASALTPALSLKREREEQARGRETGLLPVFRAVPA
jgi:hypothetical protein